MPRIPIVDRDAIDADTRALLESISGEQRWNVFEGVANHPPTLRAMDALREAVDAGLTTVEQEVIAIEIARYNGCGYCLPAHRYVCHEVGMVAADIDALTRGELLEHAPDLMLLQRFVRAALERKGHLDDDAFADFAARGIGHQRMIVVLAEIALYTLLNYFNRLAGSEIEPEVQPHIPAAAAWVTPPDR